MNIQDRGGLRTKVKLQSDADPGNTSAVTSDDSHQVLRAQSDGGKWQVGSGESLVSDDGCSSLVMCG